MDALAGVARCTLAQGDFEIARRSAAQVWTYLKEQGSQALEFPIWAYLTCAQVFEAIGQVEDCHAALEKGCQELQQRAAKISDAEWRGSFLENVAEHRTIQNFASAFSVSLKAP